MNFLQNQKCQEVEEMEVDKEPTAVIKGKFVKLLTYDVPKTSRNHENHWNVNLQVHVEYRIKAPFQIFKVGSHKVENSSCLSDS